jgi:hypothetical protein
VSSRSQIFLVYWALAFLTIFGIAAYFLMHVVPPPAPTNSDEQIAGFFTAHSMSIRIGALLAISTTGFTLPLAAVVSYQMARLGHGMRVWAILQGLAGAVVSIWLVFPVLIWGVAAFTPERPPSETRMLSDLSFLALVTPTPYFIFQILSITYVCLSSKVDSVFFPRWLGYFSIWTFLLTEVGAVGFLTKTGPFAWNGLIVFWIPLFVFFGWVLTLCYVLITGLSRESPDSELIESAS